MLWCRSDGVLDCRGGTDVFCRCQWIAVIGTPVITTRLHGSKNECTTQRASAMICGHADVQGTRKPPRPSAQRCMQPNDHLILLRDTRIVMMSYRHAARLPFRSSIFTAPGGHSRAQHQLRPLPHPLPSSRPPEQSAHTQQCHQDNCMQQDTRLHSLCPGTPLIIPRKQALVALITAAVPAAIVSALCCRETSGQPEGCRCAVTITAQAGRAHL